MENSFIEKVFNLLSSNKELPYYQAERRIDIFINVFLEDILNSKFETSKIKFLVPEFPLKKKINDSSTKVDYLCFDQEKKEIFFVELKTDNSSFNEKQLGIYLNSNDWEDCINGFRQIHFKNEKTKFKDKFKKLYTILESNGLFNIEKQKYKIRIVYILPNVSEEDKIKNKDVLFITFKELKDIKPTCFIEEWEMFLNKLINPELKKAIKKIP